MNIPYNTTPEGKPRLEAGVKHDAGKPRLGLVFNDFAKALQEVGKVGTFGAKAYEDSNWLRVKNGKQRYTDAMYRHLMKCAEGEAVDHDSKLTHLGHACWNLLAILELTLKDENEEK